MKSSDNLGAAQPAAPAVSKPASAKRSSVKQEPEKKSAPKPKQAAAKKTAVSGAAPRRKIAAQSATAAQPAPSAKRPAKKSAGSKKQKLRKLILKNKAAAMVAAGTFVAAALLLSVYFVFTDKPEKIIPPVEPVPSVEPAPETRPAPQRQQPEITAAPETPDLSDITHPSDVTHPEALPIQPVPEVAAQTTPAAVLPERVPERVSEGTLVFVIDDAGNNLRDLEPFLRFPGPLTIAVLPGLPDSVEAANRIRAAGKEVFLHQPMESLGGHNPGPGAVYAEMSESEIRAVINKNLDEIWPVAGMNNHEGSKISMDETIMGIVLDLCRERGILFLDSRTTADTTAPGAARERGMRIGERDVFLDNEPDRDSIAGYLSVGLERAGQKGNAVMIGHVHNPELAALLNEQYSLWLERGYTISTISSLIGPAGLQSADTIKAIP